MPDTAADRFLGCLLGGALGDALGYPVEFIDDAGEILSTFGAAPPRDLNYGRGASGRISDDTQMTLFTAEGMIRAYQRMASKGIVHGPSMIARAYLRWYQTQTLAGPKKPGPRSELWDLGLLAAEPRLYARRAPGNTCMSALATLSRDPNALPTFASPTNDSKGCGAVMRVAPIGLAATSSEHAFTLAAETSVLTHGHPLGYLSAAWFAAVIFDLSRGASWAQAMDAADAQLARFSASIHQEAGPLVALIAKVRRLAAQGPPSPQTVESLGGGWVGEEALAIALLCALTLESDTVAGMQAALWRSVVHAGDSDSTGSLTGNLLGARLGTAVLPEPWLATLELRDVIERIAIDLHRAMNGDERLSDTDYPGG